MFTKINYCNNTIKREFKNILKEEQNLYGIINYLEKGYKEIMVDNIIIDKDLLRIYLICDESLLIINIDFLKKQTLLISPNWQYELIFSNNFANICMPIGRLYKNKYRSVLNKSIKYLNTFYSKIKMFDLNVLNSTYSITIDELESDINERLVINVLLDENNIINNINDVLTVLSKVIDMNNFEIKVNTLGDKSDVIIINHGNLIKYIFHRDGEKYKEKIYLENNEFYIEKKVKERFDEDIPYIKKLGEMK